MTERIVLPDGQEREVEYLDDFETVRELWSEYIVQGDIRIRFKPVVSRIGLQVDPTTKKPMLNHDGTPAVVVQSQNIVITSRVKQGSTN